MIKIYRGDSTDFADLSSISVTIDTEVDITGFTGKFSFGGIEKTFPPVEIEQRTFEFNYTYEETSTFCLGKGFGTFYLFDTKGRKAVVTKVLVDVILPHEYEPHDNKFIVTISNSINYETLFHKPSINGVTINGNHDGRHYGLQNIALYDETSSYTINEQVVFENALWLCVANTDPGEFDVSKWTCLGSSIRTFPNAEAFPIVGIPGVLYIDLQTKYVYVWSTTSYVLLSTNLNPYLLGSAAAPEWNPGDTSHTVVSYKSHLYRHPSTWEQGEDATLPPTENQRWAEVTLLDLLGEKVDKVQGYGLSKNDFTDALKTKLEGVEENANNYTLPPATAQTLGGIKVGNNLSVDENGTVSADAQPQEQANWNETNTESPSYIKNKPGTATTQNAGLMAASDKATLDKIDAAFPSGASAQNELADKDFVNSSVATNTATFRGTYNLVNDLGLTIAATEQQIATAIANKLDSLVPPIVPENNDYCFVQIPTKDSTPTEIARVDRYKCTVTESGGIKTRVWGYEWSLNNSSFTANQWAAINSGITSGDVSKLAGIAAGAQVNTIETIKVNDSALTPDANKAVNISIPLVVSPEEATSLGKSADALLTKQFVGNKFTGNYFWEETREQSVGEASGFLAIAFRPSIFGLSTGDYLTKLKIRIRSSGNESQYPTSNIYLILKDSTWRFMASAGSADMGYSNRGTFAEFTFASQIPLEASSDYYLCFSTTAEGSDYASNVSLDVFTAQDASMNKYYTFITGSATRVWRPVMEVYAVHHYPDLTSFVWKTSGFCITEAGAVTDYLAKTSLGGEKVGGIRVRESSLNENNITAYMRDKIKVTTNGTTSEYDYDTSSNGIVRFKDLSDIENALHIINTGTSL